MQPYESYLPDLQIDLMINNISSWHETKAKHQSFVRREIVRFYADQARCKQATGRAQRTMNKYDEDHIQYLADVWTWQFFCKLTFHLLQS